MTKAKGLDLLREPFEKRHITKLPKPTKRDNPKGKCNECGGWHGLPAVHLDYVGHAAVTDRLLESDPQWTWEPFSLSDGLPAFDKTGGLWIKLTVCGVTRLGYGHAENSTNNGVGSREKEVIGDAIRNAAMRFGAALDLWHKGDLHGDGDEENEYDAPPKKQNIPVAKPKPAQPAPVVAPVETENVPILVRIVRLANEKQISNEEMKNIIKRVTNSEKKSTELSDQELEALWFYLNQRYPK